MAEKVELISFGVEIVPEIATGKLAEAEQQLKSGFKEIKVPINPAVDKKATQSAVKQVQQYIKNTAGDGKIQFSFDSKELKEAKKSLDEVKAKRKEIQDLQGVTSNSEIRNEARKSFLEKGADQINVLKSPSHTKDEYDTYYARAKEIYKELDTRTKNKLSEEDFLNQAMGALRAKKSIEYNVDKLSRKTSLEGWNNNFDTVKEVAETKNGIDLNQRFIKELLNKNTIGSSKGYSKLFKEWEIDPSSLGLTEFLSKQIDDQIKSVFDGFGKDILAMETFVKGKIAEYSKNWDPIFQQEGWGGIPVTGLEQSETPEEITPQKYNEAKRGTQRLMDKASKGEKLNESELQEAESYAKVLKDGVTNKKAKIDKAPEKFTKFLNQALGEDTLLRDYTISPDKEKFTRQDLIRTRGQIGLFAEKASGKSQIYLEEIQDVQKALDVWDKTHSKNGSTSKNDLDVIANVRKWLENNKDNLNNFPSHPSKNSSNNIGGFSPVDTSTSTASTSSSENKKVENANVTVNANTEQLEQALASVEGKIAELDGKTVTLTINANDESLASTQEKIDSIKAIEGNPIDIHFNANVDSINNVLYDLGALKSRDDIEIAVNFKGNTEEIEKALSSTREIRENSGNDNIPIDIKVDDSQLQTAENTLNSFREKAREPIEITLNSNSMLDDLGAVESIVNGLKKDLDIKSNSSEVDKSSKAVDELKTKTDKDINIKVNVDYSDVEQAGSAFSTFRSSAESPVNVRINTSNVLDDLVAIESIINDLKKNLDLKIKFNTGQSFSDKKATSIETMTNKIATLAEKSGVYSARVASSFAAIGSSVREVTRLVNQLNKEFNLSANIAAGLRSMNKILAGGKIGTGEKAEVSNPKSNKAKNMADRALSKSIANVDLDQYTTDFANKVEATVNKVKDLKDKHDSGVFFSDDEIEKDYDLLSKLNAELTEFGRNRNKFKLQNNQGTVVGEGIDLADFNEAKAAELFKAAGINGDILETSMGRNGMSAFIKARSRDDGKIEKYALNYNQDTGLVRSQLKSRSEYKSLFGQVVGDIGQEVTKLSKYLVSMGGIDVVWQGFQQGIESIREMDAAMTELKKVTSDTSDVYATVEKDMYSTGKEIGRDAVELTKSTADWARLGYDTKDAEKMSKWTGILMNVSEFEQVDDATNALISIMQGFDKSANDVENVVDVLNNIGNLEPISSDEIASSLQRSASALKAGGNTYEQAVALTTVGKHNCLGYTEMYNQSTHLIALVA